MADANSSSSSNVCPWSLVSPGRITIQKCTIPGCTGVHGRDYRPHGTRAPNIDVMCDAESVFFDYTDVLDS